jgi:hypothetical protein
VSKQTLTVAPDTRIHNAEVEGAGRHIPNQGGQKVSRQVRAERREVVNEIHNRNPWQQGPEARPHLPDVDTAAEVGDEYKALDRGRH